MPAEQTTLPTVERVETLCPQGAPVAVWWVIAVSLAIIAFRLVTPAGTTFPPSVMAQTGAGAGGVFAFGAELAKGVFGVYMVDVDAGTVWVYEYNGSKKCLQLAAGRLWRYDRYLEEFNVCGVTPEEVKTLVDEQRRLKLRSLEGDVPDEPSPESEGP